MGREPLLCSSRVHHRTSEDTLGSDMIQEEGDVEGGEARVVVTTRVGCRRAAWFLLLTGKHSMIFDFSEDKETIIAGLSRDFSLSPSFPPTVLFPWFSFAICRYIAALETQDDDELCVVVGPLFYCGVSYDPGFVEGLTTTPLEGALWVSFPRDHVKTPKARVRPKKAEKRGRKK